MHLNYHAWKMFVECPRKFFYKTIKKAPSTVVDNDYFKIYGLTIEKFFEMFSNHWRHDTPYMPKDLIEVKLEPIFNSVLNNSTVLWDAPYSSLTSEEIHQQIKDDIFTIMESQNQNYFLNTKAEISFRLDLKNGHKMTGRLDFLHIDALSKEVYLIDGKGSMTMGKYVDKKQLWFYALLYYFSYKKWPDHLGFFYYRYNTLTPIEVDKDRLNIYRAEISMDFKKMFSGEDYSPTPSAKACKFCIYINNCDAGLKGKIGRMRSSKIDFESDGVVAFSF